MAITPQPGYIIDPNNQNAVIRDPNVGTAQGGGPIVTPSPTGSLQNTLTTPTQPSIPSPIQAPTSSTTPTSTQSGNQPQLPANLASLGLTPEQIAQLNSPQGMNQQGFNALIDQVKNKLQLNNTLMDQRALLVKHLFDSPLTSDELAKLPTDVQHVLTSGNKDATELQLRIINDQIQGRGNSLSSSIQTLTSGYQTAVQQADQEKKDAIANIQNFVSQYGSQAPAALKALYGQSYIDKLKQEGIDIEAFSKLSPTTLSEQKLNPGANDGYDVNIPAGTIAARTNNPLNIKYSPTSVAGGTDSGIAGQDGGTFAMFATPQEGLAAAIKLLSSDVYANLTVDQAMKKWSNSGYGADVSPNTPPNAKISALSDDQKQQLVSDMAHRESGSTISVTPSNVQLSAQGLIDGSLAPSLIPAYGQARINAINAAKRIDPNFDATKSELAFQAAKRWVSAMNSTQMVRYQGLAGSVVNTIDEVKTLANQMQQSGIPLLNKAALATYIQTQGNTPKGQLASQYLAAVNTLKEEFANLANGGYAPTDAAWQLANSQINANFGVDQLNASLNEVQRLINYRLNSIGEVVPVTPGSNTFGAPETDNTSSSSLFDSLYSQYGGK